MAFGFPLGSELRQKILNFPHMESAIKSEILPVRREEIERFLNDFRQSQTTSIDSFLGRRKEYEEIGKLVIAAILLATEDHSKLILTENDDNWYQYLLNKILADSWEELDFSNLSVVTFNYDRSFEHYLLSSLMSSYGRESDEVIHALNKLKVIHVYGSLGPVYPLEESYIPYGENVNKATVELAAKSIRVIPEGRNTDESLVAARDALVASDRIGFLGFGFDPTNLERLNFDSTCMLPIQRNGVNSMRMLAATCIGMTGAECREVAVRAQQTINDAHGFPRNFIKDNCTMMLRETLLLA